MSDKGLIEIFKRDIEHRYALVSPERVIQEIQKCRDKILGELDEENKDDINFLNEVIEKFKTNNLHDRDEGIQMLYAQVSHLSENKIKKIITRKMGGAK